MLRVVGAALAIVSAGLTTAYAEGGKAVGAWFVQIEKDPFSTKKKSVAITGSGNAGALAIRCFPDSGLSVIAMLNGEKHFDPETKVPFKYRADEGAIAEETGEAFGAGSIELPIASQIRRDALAANSIYLRISTPEQAVIDLQFKTRGAAKALAQINQDCPESDAGAKSKEK